jgi:hypothetical protein
VIICRKCQQQHDDTTLACTCGADLRDHGIRVVAPGPASVPRRGPSAHAAPAAPTTSPAGAERSVAPAADAGPERVADPTTRRAAWAPTGPAIVSRPLEPLPGGPGRVRRTPSVRPDVVPEPRSTEPAEDVDVDRGAAGVAAPVPSGADGRRPERGPRGDAGVRCASCGERNGPDRRFCGSCGMARPPQRVSTSPASGGADRSDHGRPHGSGRARLRYDHAVGLRSRLTAAAVAIGLVGGGVLALGPFRGRIHDLVRSDPTVVAPDAVVLVDAAEVVGFPAESALDGDGATGVALPWESGAGAAGSLRVEFDAPLRLEALELVVGLAEDSEDGPLVLRPRLLEICVDGTCRPVEMDDRSSPQRVPLPGDEPIVAIEIHVTEIHEREWTTYPVAVIGEVAAVPR